jgi:hypothetical protein
MYGEMERMQKAIMAYFMELTQHMPGVIKDDEIYVTIAITIHNF